MAILIVGAGGQVGRELRQRAGAGAIAWDRAALDITDRAAVRAALGRVRPRVVINAAGYTAVDKAESEPARAVAANAEGPGHLAEACGDVGAALLHISTDYVFDGSKRGAWLESDAPDPRGAYAVSKWQGEQRVRAALPQHVILRVSWVFGAHGNNFVKTILRLARERPELRIVADQHGCPTSAASIAEALLHVGRQESIHWGTYHFAGTPATTWHEFATAIVDEAHATGQLPKKPPVHAITTADYPTPAPRPANSVLDCSESEKMLGLKRPDWRTDLREVLASLQAVPA